MPSRVGYLALLPLGLLGAFFVYHATEWGPWAFSDATGYIVAARNLLNGHGIGAFNPSGEFSPGVSHPPLFVLAMALCGLVGPEPMAAARILDIGAFFALIVGSGYSFYAITGSPWSALLFAAVVLVHPALMLAYVSAMAEPLFLLFGFLSLFSIAYFLRDGRTLFLILGALMAGLAAFTRYPGLAFIVAGIAAIFLLNGREIWDRLKQTAVYAAISLAPVLGFLVWSSTVPNAEPPRALRGTVDLVPALLAFGRSLVSVLWTWKPIPPGVLLPTWMAEPSLTRSLILIAGGVLVCVTAAFVIVTIIRLLGNGVPIHRSSGDVILLKVFILFVVAYVGFFLTAYLITNPTPDVDSRTMLPLLPAIVGTLITAGSVGRNAWKGDRAFPVIVSLVALTSIVGFGVITQDIVLGLHRTGLGYTGRDWQQSELIAAVRRLPPEVRVITNEPSAVTLLTGRTPYPVLEITQAKPASEFTALGTGSSVADQAFSRSGAVLVLFDTVDRQLGSLYGDLAMRRERILLENASLVLAGGDGRVFEYGRSGEGD